MADTNLIEELRTAARDVLQDKLELDKLRRFIDSGARIDQDLWRNAAELGWLSLALPEQHGGSELGTAEMAVIHEELGRWLAPIPFLPTVLCADALVAAAPAAAQDRWLPEIAQGHCIASLSSPADAVAGRLPELKKQGAKLRLSGNVPGLPSPDGAKLLLVFARDEAGAVRALLLEPASDGVAITLQQTADLTRHVGSLSIDGDIPAERLLPGDGRALAERLLTQASLALGSDSIGGAKRAFELTVEYLKTRQQFGKPIGSFQALKHRAADLRVLIEAADTAVAEAVARSGPNNDGDAATWAAMAKFYGCDAYARVAADAIQLHGGVGFTWEYYCHFFLKRAKLNQQLFGNSEWHRDRAARLLTAKAAS
ncbi:MAG TPA: acyl-CoA dehydrogenase family protein [Burkholderiales bacterium]|nr:acyl-CoA dehydrogenase family protein [Burkholderiales bacterium]